MYPVQLQPYLRLSTGSDVTTRLHQQLKVGEKHDEEDSGMMHA
jgi:hypothetical protein